MYTLYLCFDHQILVCIILNLPNNLPPRFSLLVLNILSIFCIQLYAWAKGNFRNINVFYVVINIQSLVKCKYSQFFVNADLLQTNYFRIIFRLYTWSGMLEMCAYPTTIIAGFWKDARQTLTSSAECSWLEKVRRAHYGVHILNARK